MESNPKILLCEDDRNLGLLLGEYLRAKGYDSDLYTDGESAYKGFVNGRYGLCILDVTLPKKDGLTLAREIRLVNPDVPVIFLTARNMRDDITEGFQSGADDYMSKPFSLEEFVLRIGAVLRRTKGKAKEQQVYRFANMEFNCDTHTLTIGGQSTRLTDKESRLLGLLCSHANMMLERNHALRVVWGEETYFVARSMDVYITRLRNCLNRPEMRFSFQICEKQRFQKSGIFLKGRRPLFSTSKFRACLNFSQTH